MAMYETEIEAILRKRWQLHFCIPNYTPANWWECDVFEVTKSGRFVEYEIKNSKSDFVADAKKSKRSRDKYDYETKTWVEAPPAILKHDLLAAGDVRGPSKFWFVVPQGIVTVDMVPQWAGLIELIIKGESGYYTERIAKDAPRLHNEKLSKDLADHASRTCYWRFHRARAKADNLKWAVHNLKSEIRSEERRAFYEQYMASVNAEEDHPPPEPGSNVPIGASKDVVLTTK